MTHTGKTQVRFVSGMDGVYAQPSVARQVGLGCRFAVVQDSHVEGQDDMVFDEALWRALVDFASRRGGGHHADWSTKQTAAACSMDGSVRGNACG
jgi:hypothetical protein